MTARELLVNLSLTATTTARELRDEPLQFLIQASRRLPRAVPAKLGRALRSGRPGVTRSAYAAWIADLPEEARDLLADARPRGPVGRRLFAELANQLDVPALIPPALLRGHLAKRVGQRRGDLIEPMPKFALPSSDATRPCDADAPISVFHLLTNSVPHTGSGYAYRSHAVLKAQREAGLRVAAATRLGYPVIVGKVSAKHHDVIDGIDYFRLVAPVIRRGLGDQVQQAADLLEPLVRTFGADVLSTTTDYTNALVAQEVAGRLGIPWTYEVRGLPEETWVVSKPFGAERIRAAGSARYVEARRREVSVAQAATRVFTLGRALRDDFIERGVSPDKVTVVHNAASVDLAAPTLEPVAARARLGLPREGTWVGTVTSLVDYEGIDILLEAVALARSQGNDLRALVVGDGTARPSLEAGAERLGLKAGIDVFFAGRVPYANSLMYYQALDIFAVPRRDERVCRLVPPLKPLNAMAVGRPIVASDLPALRQLIASAACGILAPAGQTAMWLEIFVDLSKRNTTRNAYGIQGRAYTENHSWAAAGTAYSDALTSISNIGSRSV